MGRRTSTQTRLSGEVVEKIVIELSDRGPAPAPRCYVYEVWDTRNRLAYVGMADHFERRWAQHRRNSYWMGEIEVRMVHISGYRSREDARQVEAGTINDQSAVYNTDKEAPAYARYRALWGNEARMNDPWDCAPITRTIYKWDR